MTVHYMKGFHSLPAAETFRIASPSMNPSLNAIEVENVVTWLNASRCLQGLHTGRTV